MLMMDKIHSLTETERDLIEKVRRTYKARTHVGCTACGYCMPCPEGVDIPLNLNLLNDVYLYQNLEKPSGNYKFLKLRGAVHHFAPNAVSVRKNAPRT